MLRNHENRGNIFKEINFRKGRFWENTGELRVEFIKTKNTITDHVIGNN